MAADDTTDETSLLRMIRGDRLDTIGAEKAADFADLAGIMAGDDQPAALQSPRQRPVALSCAAKISAQPIRARRSSRNSPSSS